LFFPPCSQDQKCFIIRTGSVSNTSQSNMLRCPDRLLHPSTWVLGAKQPDRELTIYLFLVPRLGMRAGTTTSLIRLHSVVFRSRGHFSHYHYRTRTEFLISACLQIKLRECLLPFSSECFIFPSPH